jgi:hypothetical protein
MRDNLRLQGALSFYILYSSHCEMSHLSCTIVSTFGVFRHSSFPRIPSVALPSIFDGDVAAFVTFDLAMNTAHKGKVQNHCALGRASDRDSFRYKADRLDRAIQRSETGPSYVWWTACTAHSSSRRSNCLEFYGGRWSVCVKHSHFARS